MYFPRKQYLYRNYVFSKKKVIAYDDVFVKTWFATTTLYSLMRLIHLHVLTVFSGMSERYMWLDCACLWCFAIGNATDCESSLGGVCKILAGRPLRTWTVAASLTGKHSCGWLYPLKQGCTHDCGFYFWLNWCETRESLTCKFIKNYNQTESHS